MDTTPLFNPMRNGNVVESSQLRNDEQVCRGCIGQEAQHPATEMQIELLPAAAGSFADATERPWRARGDGRPVSSTNAIISTRLMAISPMMFTAKKLRDPIERERRISELQLPHVAPLTDFVRALRQEKGPEYGIPYFDPADGGTQAEILFLLEAPGPRAVQSGFVSRDNPDETAKNFLLLCDEARIDRRRTACWNIVPWYIGTGERIRPATSKDVAAGARSLDRLLALLPAVTTIVLVGAKASRARTLVASLRPSAALVDMPHPSPMFVNRRPENRARILAILKLLPPRRT